MEYKYLLEERTNKNIILNNCVLHILCYNVEEQCKYPFLEFMMEKTPYCNNIVKEHITLPCVFLCNNKTNIEQLVIKKVKSSLNVLGYDDSIIKNEMFKGILLGKDNKTHYALVNITGINMYGINYMRNTTYWFVLPSEIINTQNVCNINIDSNITNLFINEPEIGMLHNYKTNNNYIIPDAVYTKSNMTEAKFFSIFGNIKKKIYDNCGVYYFFFRSFDKCYNLNKEYVNRYALFVEGNIYFEKETRFILTDENIESLYPEECLIICYKENNIEPDILVKKYENFICLSYHKLDKNLKEPNNMLITG